MRVRYRLAILPSLIGAGVALSLGAMPLAAADCRDREGALGVSRTVAIDARGGGVYGDLTRQAKAGPLLAPMEVVLTFDDGPVPWITTPILNALDAACTKATFFAVGRMAVAHPQTVRDVLARGHTLGTHTWSHRILTQVRGLRAEREIELGVAAITRAAGQPIAPFFRFPGLNDSRGLVGYLAKRDIATFTVDVVSDDSFVSDPGFLARRTLQRVAARRGGIVLFHDIKSVTAKALPAILAGLKAGGFRVVHLTAVQPVAVVARYEGELEPLLPRQMRELDVARVAPREAGGAAARSEPGDASGTASGWTAQTMPDTGSLRRLDDEPTGPRVQGPAMSAWGHTFRGRAVDDGKAEPVEALPSREDWAPGLRGRLPPGR